MRHLNPVHRGVAAAAAAAVSLSLVPAGASAAETEPAPEPVPAPVPAPVPDESAEPLEELAAPDTTTVRLKVARQDRRTVEAVRNRPRPMLRTQGVEVSRRDKVRLIRAGERVPYGERRDLREGDVVRVVRIDVRVQRKRVRVRNRTVTRTVDHLRPGVRREVRPGRDGVRVIRIKRTFRNHRKVDTDRRAHLVRKPRPRVVQVGRRYGSVAGADHLNWRALANCESSGNPRAVNWAGPYYGLYQFNAATWRSVGGRGLPHQASATEQTYRAKLLYKQRGRSPWPHCGRLL